MGQSIDDINIDINVFVVVLSCPHDVQRDKETQAVKGLQYTQIGPYFCYRVDAEPNIINILDIHEDDASKERKLKLRIEEKDLVNFDKIPLSSI